MSKGFKISLGASVVTIACILLVFAGINSPYLGMVLVGSFSLQIGAPFLVDEFLPELLARLA